MKEYLKSYETLLGRLDEFFENTRRRYPQAIVCRPGCSDCCHRDISLFPFEAQIIIHAVSLLSEKVRERILKRAQLAHEDPLAPCPLLHEEKCEVYAKRSVICRTHGLPCLVTTAKGKREMSFCPYNFHGLMKIDGDCVLDLDPVNRALATINHLACADAAISPERVKISYALLSGLGQMQRSAR